MKPLLLLPVIGVLLITSCKKSANTLNNSAGGSVLYKTLRFDQFGDTLTTVYYLNRQGLDSANISTTSSPGGPSQMSKFLFEYDVQGKMVKMTEVSDGGTVRAVYTFDRDDKGRMIHTKVSPAGARYTFSYAYNDKDQVIADTMYNTLDGRLISYRAYGYDAKGNQAQEEVFNAADHPLASVGKFTWTFDDKINPFSYQGFHEMLLASGATQLLGPNNVLAQYAGSEVANTPAVYKYYDEGLPKLSGDKDGFNTKYFYH